MQIKLNALALGLMLTGLPFAANAEFRYYDPTNASPGSDSGKTVGYQLFNTIGCPGKQLLEPDCVQDTPKSEPVTASLPAPVPAPAPVAAPEPVQAPAPVAAQEPAATPEPVQYAKAEIPQISNQANTFCNLFKIPSTPNPYLPAN